MSEKEKQEKQEKKPRPIIIEEKDEYPPAATTGTYWRQDSQDLSIRSREDSPQEDSTSS